MVNSKVKKWTIIGLVAIILCFTSFFIIRTIVLNKVLDKAKLGLQHKLNLNLTYQSVGFKQFRSIYIQNLTLTDSLEKAVFHVDSIFFRIRVLPLFTGKIRFSKFVSKNLYIDIDNKLVIKMLHSRNGKATTDSIQPVNYAKTFNRIFKALFSVIPGEVQMDSTVFRYQREKLKLSVSCGRFKMEDNAFSGNIHISDTLNQSDLKLSGFIDAGSQNFNITGCSNNQLPITLPYLNQRWGFSVKFDTLQFSFNLVDDSWKKLQFAGKAHAANFEIQNKRIAPTPVVFNNTNLDFRFNAGERYIELDSTSIVSANAFSFSPYVKLEKNEGYIITIQIPRKEFEASSFIESFPEGLFSNLRGMKVAGKLAYSLNFQVDLKIPDSLKFSSHLENLGFKIVHYGNTNLQMINDTFVHTVYEKDREVNQILVGAENPNYTHLENISNYLKFSVLTSEDGDFFYHKGFNEEAFKNSIATNIKAKRFARGGSTISMQLVKNIYLTRNKTVTRKLEEALIVWMIENLHLVSKERMFEVYLNIIEWGPGIYGIKEASEFYFNKKPSELTLEESIFLASIIPSPKYFKYAFKKEGQLTDYYSWFYSRLPDVMVRRNQIQASDTIGLKHTITLTGPAKEFLIKPDTTIIDSIYINNPALILDESDEESEK
jgi:hypothetical protein